MNGCAIQLFAVYLCQQRERQTFKLNKMTSLLETKENNAKVEALKSISTFKWAGTTIHPNMEYCLRAINMQSNNSGHYNPLAVRVPKLPGWYMVNQDGSLFVEARIIKKSNNEYLIEYLSNKGYDQFESLYSDLV